MKTNWQYVMLRSEVKGLVSVRNKFQSAIFLKYVQDGGLIKFEY